MLTIPVQANGASATCIVFGAPQQKELTELVPGILNQLGPEALANLKQMASQYQANSSAGGAGAIEEDDDGM
jgi:nascent polypeptide-associated complex subunit beta